jgi:hypothetical protein
MPVTAQDDAGFRKRQDGLVTCAYLITGRMTAGSSAMANPQRYFENGSTLQNAVHAAHDQIPPPPMAT